MKKRNQKQKPEIKPISSIEDNTSNWLLDGKKVAPLTCDVWDKHQKNQNS